MAGVVDESSAREVGKLFGVEGLLFGQVVTYKCEAEEKGIKKVERKIGTGKYRIVTGGKKKVREEIKRTVLVDRSYVVRRGALQGWLTLKAGSLSLLKQFLNIMTVERSSKSEEV